MSQFAVEPAACRFEGDDTRLRIRVIAGLILISQLDILIDGNPILAEDIEIVDGEAFITVEPGLHAWTLIDQDTDEVLATGETLCPTCFNLVTPTGGAGAVETQPASDMGDGFGSTQSIALLVIVLAGLATGIAVLSEQRR